MHHLSRSGPDLDVVVVGNIGIDTNVYLPGQDIDFSREANFTDNLDGVGQAGGYSARGWARLGYRTAFIGCVGDDFSGRHIRATLERDGIDTTGLFIDPAGTSRSVNLMYRDGRRKNFYDGKSHMSLMPDLEMCRRVLERARLVHVHLPNWARHPLPIARELGLTVAVDLQDVADPDDPYRRDFIEAADILFFSGVNHGDPRRLIERFRAGRPERVVVVGMGADGAALADRNGVRVAPPVTMAAPVVDTNGAGDGLAVGFLSGYVFDEGDADRALRRGQIVARHTCTLRGKSEGLIDREALERHDGSCRRRQG